MNTSFSNTTVEQGLRFISYTTLKSFWNRFDMIIDACINNLLDNTKLQKLTLLIVIIITGVIISAAYTAFIVIITKTIQIKINLMASFAFITAFDIKKIIAFSQKTSIKNARAKGVCA